MCRYKWLKGVNIYTFMKLFVHGFWSGFFDKTNALHKDFFIDLFTLVFNEEIEISMNYEECDILLETVFSNETFLFNKSWKYSFLFSGESRLNKFKDHYTCILYGERNHNNIVNVPLFIPYLYCNNLSDKMKKNNGKERVFPTKNICAIISNGNGIERNLLLDKIDKRIQIDYAGQYRNNTEKIDHYYNTDEFIDFVSQYKFVVSMENSRADTYITEKITHGFLSSSIPIYWGSLRVTDYFNNERFINIQHENNNIDLIIDRIEEICNNNDEYLNIIKQPIFSFERTIYDIVRDIRNFLFTNPYKSISQIYLINNPEFEPDRYTHLNKLFFETLQVSRDKVQFICPTYKHTITDEMMNKLVKTQLVTVLRHLNMKKSEISLFLNYKAVLESIERNYTDGNFLIFESDVMLNNNEYLKLDEFLTFVKTKEKSWHAINIGFGTDDFINTIDFQMFTPNNTYEDRQHPFYEDCTTINDRYRLIRKFGTRCTDSILWTYSGIKAFLEYMNKNDDYCIPFDYYMSRLFYTNFEFKQYWTNFYPFIQGTNCGYMKSAIQDDKL